MVEKEGQNVLRPELDCLRDHCWSNREVLDARAGPGRVYRDYPAWYRRRFCRRISRTSRWMVWPGPTGWLSHVDLWRNRAALALPKVYGSWHISHLSSMARLRSFRSFIH